MATTFGKYTIEKKLGQGGDRRLQEIKQELYETGKK